MKQNSMFGEQVMQSAKYNLARRRKTEISVYETNEWKWVDLTWNSVVHQDSENIPELEMN